MLFLRFLIYKLWKLETSLKFQLFLFQHNLFWKFNLFIRCSRIFFLSHNIMWSVKRSNPRIEQHLPTNPLVMRSAERILSIASSTVELDFLILYQGTARLSWQHRRNIMYKTAWICKLNNQNWTLLPLVCWKLEMIVMSIMPPTCHMCLKPAVQLYPVSREMYEMFLPRGKIGGLQTTTSLSQYHSK